MILQCTGFVFGGVKVCTGVQAADVLLLRRMGRDGARLFSMRGLLGGGLARFGQGRVFL